ncbi:hypothetical protein D1BOALGB6SA_10246 [Olavius sp. associated proteobacterium Delta 1]|nr:hypothetical protein D1BOALGB6SA_10246 [Olavius sp. associated proteobacterium Delta 1]
MVGNWVVIKLLWEDPSKLQENQVDGPVLRYYFDQCGIARIIDDHVELDPRRKILTHGQAAVAMITAILFQVMQWSIKK